MADTKISALASLTGANVDTSSDVLPIVDTSVATTKKILVSELGIALGIPAGMIFDYGATSAPVGYLGCDGSAVSRATYAALFAAIATTWGAGDTSTTFNVPNLNRRITMGSGGVSTTTIGNAVGNTGGEETHTLTNAELPSGTMGTWNGVNNDVGAGAAGSKLGGGTAHNNIQPSAIVLKIIKT